MLPALLPYPEIDPVLIEIGPFAVRWYALAYIAGLVLGWRYVVRMLRTARLWHHMPEQKPPARVLDIDDLLLWATLGVVLGGRLGYVLFYGMVFQPAYYIENPLRVLAIWQGGMSFHGGALGVILAVILFCRARTLDVFRVGDLVAAATPIGLFFGRIANFINGELYGRPSNVPWAMVFPGGGDLPRHPSQLYEAALEGIALFLILRVVTHQTRALERPGLTVGCFLAGYGLFRAFVEFFREPDAPLGDTFLTMGMMLSVPMWLAAAWFIWRSGRVKATAATKATSPEKATAPNE